MKMDILTRETMNDLIEAQGYPCISLYMPTRHDLPTGEENRTRFKTMLRQAREVAADAAHNEEEVLKAMFEPAERLISDSHYWRQQGLGLAMFASPQHFSVWRLPLEFEELAVSAPHFHVKPLLPLFSDDGHFYILAMSLNKVRFFRCTRHTCHEVELPAAPQSLEESMRYDDPEKQLQFHTGDSRPQDSRPAVHHGQGVGHDDKDVRVEEFLRKVDNAVFDRLADDRAPVVAACVENNFAPFSAVSRLKNLAPVPLRGNPDELSVEELRRGALEVVEPMLQRARREAVDRFHERKGTGLASSMLEEVVAAAMHGRVATLFVPLGVQLWGEFDQGASKITLHEAKKPQGRDLLDMAAAQTFTRSGQVFAVAQSEVPGTSEAAPVAAIFRY